MAACEHPLGYLLEFRLSRCLGGFPFFVKGGDLVNKKAGLIWVDAQGQRVLHIITTDTGVGSIEAALEAHSNAAVVECFEGDDEVNVVVTSTSRFPSCRDTVLLNFSDGAGSIARLYLPAPIDDIFLSDGVTVDPSKIGDVISAATSHLLSGAGNLVVAFDGGQLIGTKFSGLVTVQP